MIIRNCHLWGDFDLYPTAWLKYAGYNGALWVFRNRWLMSMQIDQSGICPSVWRNRYSGPTRWYCIIKFANVWLGHGVVISRERVNLIVENEDELGILDGWSNLGQAKYHRTKGTGTRLTDPTAIEVHSMEAQGLSRIATRSNWLVIDQWELSRSCLLFPRP